LAYWGDPTTRQPVAASAEGDRAWLWDVGKVTTLAADHNRPR
jgi:hypothetical protein